jgi:hypothetical protein
MPPVASECRAAREAEALGSSLHFADDAEAFGSREGTTADDVEESDSDNCVFGGANVTQTDFQR